MRELLIRAKFWFYEHSGALTVLTIAGGGAVALTTAPIQVAATLLASGLATVFVVQKQKLEELEAFRRLFKDFNERYDQMDDKLRSIIALPDAQELTQEERSDLVAYFNLCGEEYLAYFLGNIHPLVWRAWRKGMEEFLLNPRIRPLWVMEARKESYYGLEKLAPFVEGRLLAGPGQKLLSPSGNGK